MVNDRRRGDADGWKVNGGEVESLVSARQNIFLFSTKNRSIWKLSTRCYVTERVLEEGGKVEGGIERKGGS